MDQQKRLFLAIALSFGLTLVFTQFVWKADPSAALDGGFAALSYDGGAVAMVAPQNPVAVPVVLQDGGIAQAPPIDNAPLRRIEQTRPTMKVAFSSEGGAFEDAILTGPREHEQQHLTIPEGWKKLFGGTFPPAPQMDLASPPQAGAGQMATSIVGASPLSARARYAVVDEQPGHVTFATTSGPWEVTKTWSWDVNAKPSEDPKLERDATPYLFTLDVTVKNISAAAVSGDLVVHTSRAIDPASETAPSMFGGIGNEATVLCRSGDDIKRKRPDNDKPTQEEPGTIHFVGIDQQYFLSAVWPKTGALSAKCVLNATTTTRVAELYAPMTLQPNEVATRSYGVFLGPKDIELLLMVGKGKAEGAPSFQPGLDKTVDFGIWAFICKGLIVLLRVFHALVGNWGVAIILLTVMVKVVLLPLTHRAMVSAEGMKKLQPKMEEIKKKFAEDKEKQNLEVMKLYQEAKVNPLGGCLPLLLQLPIWAALFTTLRTSYELYGEPFFGVWSDLTFKDPTYLLPTLLGITMIVTQRLQPQMMDKSQAFLMTWVMPIFFTAIMMNYPAGLSLYIFTNNLLSIVQQFALRRYLERTGVAAPRKKDDKKVRVA